MFNLPNARELQAKIALAESEKASAAARKQAAAETGLARGAFPEECPWDLDGALADRGEDNEADGPRD